MSFFTIFIIVSGIVLVPTVSSYFLPLYSMIAAHVPLLGVDVWEHVYNSVLTVLSRAISDSSNNHFSGLGILPTIQKRAARLSQGNLVCDQLEDRRRKVCKGTMTGIIISIKGRKHHLVDVVNFYFVKEINGCQKFYLIQALNKRQ